MKKQINIFHYFMKHEKIKTKSSLRSDLVSLADRYEKNQ